MDKTLSNCQHSALLLKGMLEGIGHLDNEGHENAMTAVIEVASQLAERLSNDLDAVNMRIMNGEAA
ncbi:hypothetical protein LZG00_15900 [Rhodobacteraceae bacterium LMO-12]|nr:hypothetical protein [Rhodobacteraceae bacterium LMO-JJ12]